MLREFAQYLATLAVSAESPKLLYESSYAKTYAVAGKIERVPVETPPRAHRVNSLDELILYANRCVTNSAEVGLEDQGDEPIPSPSHETVNAGDATRFIHEDSSWGVQTVSPVIWYDEQRIILVIDDGTRRLNRVTFEPSPSDVFTILKKLRETPAFFPQRDFIRLLRVELAGTLDEGALLSRVRKLDFSVVAKNTGDVARNRESYGNSIASECKGSSEIPESVTLSVPVYRSEGMRDRYPLRCAVELDTRGQSLQLLPLPDEIQAVEQMAIASIRVRLMTSLSASVATYYGTP
jgi:hypothetical protein